MNFDLSKHQKQLLQTVALKAVQGAWNTALEVVGALVAHDGKEKRNAAATCIREAGVSVAHGVVAAFDQVAKAMEVK